MIMGTTATRRACPLLVILLLQALLLRGYAASITGLINPHEAEDLGWEWSDEDASWGNETIADPVFAAIARRAAAGGYSYGRVRSMISMKCPRRAINEAMGVVTKRCYAREVRRLEESLKPPPPGYLPVPWMLSVTTIDADRWPKLIVNPVIWSKPRLDDPWRRF